MHDPSESEARWGGDSNAEWMNLAVETADLGTWEFNLEEGTGFISERCAEIIGTRKFRKARLFVLKIGSR
jgi:hypothetical protein